VEKVRRLIGCLHIGCVQMSNIDFGVVSSTERRSVTVVLESLSSEARVVDFRCDAPGFQHHEQVVLPPTGSALVTITMGKEDEETYGGPVASVPTFMATSSSNSLKRVDSIPVDARQQDTGGPSFWELDAQLDVEYNSLRVPPQSVRLEALVGQPLSFPIASCMFVPCWRLWRWFVDWLLKLVLATVVVVAIACVCGVCGVGVACRLCVWRMSQQRSTLHGR